MILLVQNNMLHKEKDEERKKRLKNYRKYVLEKPVDFKPTSKQLMERMFADIEHFYSGVDIPRLASLQEEADRINNPVNSAVKTADLLKFMQEAHEKFDNPLLSHNKKFMSAFFPDYIQFNHADADLTDPTVRQSILLDFLNMFRTSDVLDMIDNTISNDIQNYKVLTQAQKANLSDKLLELLKKYHSKPSLPSSAGQVFHKFKDSDPKKAVVELQKVYDHYNGLPALSPDQTKEKKNAKVLLETVLSEMAKKAKDDYAKSKSGDFADVVKEVEEKWMLKNKGKLATGHKQKVKENGQIVRRIGKKFGVDYIVDYGE